MAIGLVSVVASYVVTDPGQGDRWSNILEWHLGLWLTAMFAVLARDWWRSDLRSEEHTSELQSLMRISYAVFCLKKKKTIIRKVIRTIRQDTTPVHIYTAVLCDHYRSSSRSNRHIEQHAMPRHNHYMS